ncbi:hypothetical protein ANCCEY_01048 [Ancylostoma ceylanicum]|uniref:Uncharacterized protein n=1 Tax=Ancylostoma ceylanicum TaxID=53326 RepID=A0A0D6MD08_9BILA|nr:hypothetical protein ANCCEY_01048 [Ancylostoma ceylanicum]
MTHGVVSSSGLIPLDIRRLVIGACPQVRRRTARLPRWAWPANPEGAWPPQTLLLLVVATSLAAAVHSVLTPHTMSDSVKKPKSSLLLYLLIVVTVLVLLCAATILYLVAGSRTLTEQPQNATSSQLFLVPDSTPGTPNVPATTVTTSTTTTTTDTTASLFEYTTTTTTTTPESAEVTSPVPTEEEAFEEITISGSHTDANAEVVDKCASIVAQRVTCPKTRDDVIALPPSALSPLHYSLNLSIETVMPTQLNGDVQIYIRANEAGKQITLDVDNELRNVEDIHVVNCDTGGCLVVYSALVSRPLRSLWQNFGPTVNSKEVPTKGGKPAARVSPVRAWLVLSHREPTAAVACSSRALARVLFTIPYFKG